ncbi:MAG TPA: hypothetical protein PK771_13325 [Spirochaetota bacterium]|nr:hypothetical protein [Spirochaetota bacterium]
MKKLVPDLMVVNKIIIFLENLCDEDVDLVIFSTKIIQDIEFIDSATENIFDEYISNIKLYNSDNLLKLYFSTIKRFHKLLIKVQKYTTFFNKHTKDLITTLDTKLEDKIKKMKDYDYRSNILKIDKQLINEEEYNLLLKLD